MNAKRYFGCVSIVMNASKVSFSSHPLTMSRKPELIIIIIRTDKKVHALAVPEFRQGIADCM
jgi:hypothetical protein